MTIIYKTLYNNLNFKGLNKIIFFQIRELFTHKNSQYRNRFFPKWPEKALIIKYQSPLGFPVFIHNAICQFSGYDYEGSLC